MAVPMKHGGMRTGKIIYYVILSGVTTGIGAFFGALVGGISQTVIAMCLAFAAGASAIGVGSCINKLNSLLEMTATATQIVKIAQKNKKKILQAV